MDRSHQSLQYVSTSKLTYEVTFKVKLSRKHTKKHIFDYNFFIWRNYGILWGDLTQGLITAVNSAMYEIYIGGHLEGQIVT